MRAGAANRTIILSDAAWSVVCGMVHGTEDVETEDIYPIADVWDEIREAFPLAQFVKAVKAGAIEYGPFPSEAMRDAGA